MRLARGTPARRAASSPPRAAAPVRAGHALALCALLASSCLHESYGPRPAPAAAAHGELQPRRKLDPQTGRPLREWAVLVYPDRAPQKHGRETVWYPSGAKQWEREYHEGEPRGAWRSWYEDGTPRSEAFFAGAGVETTMTFWHANGVKSLQGPARDGVKCGAWTAWYPSGAVSERGEYVRGMREGTWNAWSLDGAQRFEVVYVRNVRKSETPVEPAGGTSAPAPRAAVPPGNPLDDAAGDASGDAGEGDDGAAERERGHARGASPRRGQ